MPLGLGAGECVAARTMQLHKSQLQTLNFAAMDLSEFYASLVPMLPNVATLQGNGASRIPTCYYGQGRCQ